MSFTTWVFHALLRTFVWGSICKIKKMTKYKTIYRDSKTTFCCLFRLPGWGGDGGPPVHAGHSKHYRSHGGGWEVRPLWVSVLFLQSILLRRLTFMIELNGPSEEGHNFLVFSIIVFPRVYLFISSRGFCDIVVAIKMRISCQEAREASWQTFWKLLGPEFAFWNTGRVGKWYDAKQMG